MFIHNAKRKQLLATSHDWLDFDNFIWWLKECGKNERKKERNLFFLSIFLSISRVSFNAWGWYMLFTIMMWIRHKRFLDCMYVCYIGWAKGLRLSITHVCYEVLAIKNHNNKNFSSFCCIPIIYYWYVVQLREKKLINTLLIQNDRRREQLQLILSIVSDKEQIDLLSWLL